MSPFLLYTFVTFCGLFTIYAVLLFATYVTGVERAIILIVQAGFFGLLTMFLFQHSLLVPDNFEHSLAARVARDGFDAPRYRMLLVVEMALMFATVVSMCVIQALRLWEYRRHDA